MNRFAESQLWGNSFGATALGHSFGEQRRGTALGNNFGEQLRGSSFVQLSGLTLRQLRGEFFEIEASLGCDSGYLWVATLKNNFGAQFYDFVITLTNNYFEKR